MQWAHAQAHALRRVRLPSAAGGGGAAASGRLLPPDGPAAAAFAFAFAFTMYHACEM